MPLYRSLGLKLNVTVLVAYVLVALATLAMSSGTSIYFIAPGAILGALAGAMQVAALRGRGEAFRAAQTIKEVRRALREHPWGARYRVYDWIVRLSFVAFAGWIAQSAPAGSGLFWWVAVFMSLFSGFVIARQGVTLPALAALARDH